MLLSLIVLLLPTLPVLSSTFVTKVVDEVSNISEGEDVGKHFLSLFISNFIINVLCFTIFKFCLHRQPWDVIVSTFTPSLPESSNCK